MRPLMEVCNYGIEYEIACESACESASARNPVRSSVCEKKRMWRKLDSKWVKIICIEQSSKYRIELSDSKDGPEPSPQLESSSCKRGIIS